MFFIFLKPSPSGTTYLAATRILIAWHDFGNWRMEFIYQTLSGVTIIVLFVIIIFRVLRTLVF